MNLGTTMIVFIIVSLVLIALYCLLLKYYHYRQRKKMKQAAKERYELNRDISIQSMFDCEGQYDEFCKRRRRRNPELGQELIDGELIEMNELRKVFDTSNNIYSGHQNLQNKLTSGIQSRSEGGRQSTSKLSLRLSKLSTFEEDPGRNSRKNLNYKFNRIFSKYDRKGLKVFELVPVSITLDGEEVTLKKTVERTQIEKDSDNFQDFLENYGYDLYGYGCYIVECEVDVGNLHEKMVYPFTSLKVKEQKREISSEQFEKLVDDCQQLKQI